MNIAWGTVLVVLGSIAWIGQCISWLRPDTAVRLGVTEVRAEVEPVLWADIRGEAPWDALTLWTLPAAGWLLMLDVAAWAYFGLVGGAIYVYFGGRGIFQRLSLQRRGMRIGSDRDVRVGLIFLAIWATAGAVTIAVAVSDLPTA